MGIFAEFKDDPDPEVRQRARNWSVAIGLQDVDHLSVSQFLIDTAKRNIRGEITQEEVERLIEEYHSMRGWKQVAADIDKLPSGGRKE